MIGFTQPGSFIAVNKKMFQSDWDNMGYAIRGISYPGYWINLVYVALLRSTKIFASGHIMTFDTKPSGIYGINSGFTISDSSLYTLQDVGNQTFEDFKNAQCNIIMGQRTVENQSQFADAYLILISQNNVTPIYGYNTANDVYCYLSLGFYLTPQR